LQVTTASSSCLSTFYDPYSSFLNYQFLHYQVSSQKVIKAIMTLHYDGTDNGQNAQRQQIKLFVQLLLQCGVHTFLRLPGVQSVQ